VDVSKSSGSGLLSSIGVKSLITGFFGASFGLGSALAISF